MFQARKIIKINSVALFASVSWLLTGCIDLTSDDDHKMGKFIDSEVIGLAYQTATQSGRTNLRGEFKYLEDETVQFSVGDIELPSTLAQPVVTPLNLVNTKNLENTEVVNILRFLQTLDRDRNPDNGIEISQDMHLAAKDKSLDFSSESFETEPATVEFLQEALGDSSALVASVDAIEHFIESMEFSVEKPAFEFENGFVNSNAFFILTPSEIGIKKSVNDLDSLYFENGQLHYTKSGNIEYGLYTIENGILKINLETASESLYIAIHSEEDGYLNTCWSKTPLGSLLCEDDEDFVKLFYNTTSATFFLAGTDGDSTDGDSTGGDSTDGDSTGGDSTGGDSTGGDSTGGDSTGGDSTGGDSTGGDSTGGDNTGGDNTGGDNTGGDNTGGDSTGGDSTGGDSTGGDNTGGDNTGGDNTGGDNTGEDNNGVDGADNNSGGNNGAEEPDLGSAESGNHTKFNPGHYVFMEISRKYDLAERNRRRIEFIKSHINNPNIKGFLGIYDWRYLEPSKNSYNFQNIREILELLEGTGKQLGIYPKDRTFGSSCTNAPVPDYLRNSGNAYKAYGYVCMLKLYKPEVMDRLIALYREIGRNFDNHPNFELVINGESTIAPEDGDSSFSHEGWKNELIRFFQESKSELKHTLITMQMNFLGSQQQIEDVAAAMARTGGGALGLPDTVPCRRTDIPDSEVCGYRIDAYDVLRKYNNVMAITPLVETWDLIYEQTPEVLDMAVDYLGATHVLWQSEFVSRRDSRQFIPNYLENQLLPTIESQGARVNTACPSSLEPCSP